MLDDLNPERGRRPAEDIPAIAIRLIETMGSPSFLVDLLARRALIALARSDREAPPGCLDRAPLLLIVIDQGLATDRLTSDRWRIAAAAAHMDLVLVASRPLNEHAEQWVLRALTESQRVMIVVTRQAVAERWQQVLSAVPVSDERCRRPHPDVRPAVGRFAP